MKFGQNEPHFLLLDGKDSFFWLIKKAKKGVCGWTTAARCDSFFGCQRGKEGGLWKKT
jgi:hypothetical protein